MSKRHEQLLFRYSSALERGDFEAVAEVLHESERDPALEQMILDMNAAYNAEASVNHKNPKEVPMIAALYQKQIRPPARLEWQSLPLVAALAVIGLLVVLLAVQTRGANLLSTGQNGTPLAVAQNRILCETKTLTSVNLLTFPTSTNGVVLGTLPAGTSVQVLDAQSLNNEQGIAIHWYFISAQGIQGWVSMDALDVRGCPQVGIAQAQAATSQARLLATVSAMSGDLASFTPTLSPLLNSEDAVGQENATQSALMTHVCKAITLIPADIRTFPTLSSVVKKSLPAQIIVTLGEYTITNDSQGHGQIWYFVESEGVQGWMMASLLDASVCPPILDAATVIPPPVVPLPNADTAGVAQHPFYIYTPPPPAVMTAIIATALATMNAPYQPMATPTLIPDDQQGGVPAVKCPTPSSVSRIMMYARPSLDSFKFSQVYDAARYAFFLLDSTEVDGQTWYFVRIGATVDEKQGWITWDDYNILKDCAPFNAVTQADAVPSDSTLPLVPTIVPASVQALPTFTPTPADIQAVATIAPSVSASVTDHFPIYTVQAGDTVLAILSQFGLDAEALPRLQALNFLSNAVNLRPGMALVIPASLPDSVTTCTILSGQSIEMRADPLKADPLVYFLPQPTSFVIEGEFQNGDGMWAAVSAQASSITMAGVWIRVDQMDGAAACSQSDATLVIATPTLVR